MKQNQYIIEKLNTNIKDTKSSLGAIPGQSWRQIAPHLENSPLLGHVEYAFPLTGDNPKGKQKIEAKQGIEAKQTRLALGQEVSLVHCGGYRCVCCGAGAKKITNGFCYPCLMKKAAADTCVLSPHRCHFLSGTCREPQWGLEFCYQPHFVYLAHTDKYKVGVTRESQLLTRWADQGATLAAPLCRVYSRHQAGVLEKALTTIVSDRSHWQSMLKAGNDAPSHGEFTQKFQEVQAWLKEFVDQNPNAIVPIAELAATSSLSPIEVFSAPHLVQLCYPVQKVDSKIQSISLEKEGKISATLTGIKGQYLFFGDRVFNVRRHEGFVVDLEIEPRA